MRLNGPVIPFGMGAAIEDGAMRTVLCGAAISAVILTSGTGTAEGLPAGTAQDSVEAICTGCHGTNLIERSRGYTHEQWDDLTAAMVDLSGDPETKAQIVGYLAEHFPPGDNRAATPTESALAVDYEEWAVPTLGQRARDPVEAPDGSIWWVGQWADILGRLDPKTGTMTEFALPAGAKPHSVTIGPHGRPWYTGNGNGTLGRLDPQTGEVEVFEIPDPAARDPHTAEFDAKGRFFITLQQSNMVGRLDPGTGEIRLVTAPMDGARPYGVKVAADGKVWVACNGSNCLLELDPETMEITEVELPDPGSTVRRLDIDANGMIWFVNSSLGRLGRYDPTSGEVREWPSPSGPSSHPYAIAVFDGAIWYNESGVRPDMLVRFDPATERFQSWPIPSGDLHAGILRHMRVGRDGDALLIHQTATNTIGRVRVPSAIR